MKTLALLKALACCILLALPAAASQFATLDGGSIRLQKVVLPEIEPDGGGLGLDSCLRTGLAYELIDGAGQSYEGVLSGVVGLRGELPFLAQEPVTGDLFLVYAGSLGGGSDDIIFRTWLGQAWSEARWLAGSSDPSFEDSRPKLAFTTQGDALLVWETDGGLVSRERVLFQLGRMDREGMSELRVWIDMGSPARYRSPMAGGDVRLPAGVASLSTDSVTRTAFLVFGEPEREEAGVLRLDLAAFETFGGGGSFAPVPVNFAVPVTMGNTPGEILARAGVLVLPWRAELVGSELYYWFEDGQRIRGIAFRDNRCTPLVTLPWPGNEAMAHVHALSRLRQALVRLDLETSPLLALDRSRGRRASVPR